MKWIRWLMAERFVLLWFSFRCGGKGYQRRLLTFMKTVTPPPSSPPSQPCCVCLLLRVNETSWLLFSLWPASSLIDMKKWQSCKVNLRLHCLDIKEKKTLIPAASVSIMHHMNKGDDIYIHIHYLSHPYFGDLHTFPLSPSSGYNLPNTLVYDQIPVRLMTFPSVSAVLCVHAN